MGIDLTIKQQKAIKDAKKFYKDKSKQVFTVSGYAGCLDEDTFILTNKGYITMGSIIDMELEKRDFLGFKDFTKGLKVYNGKEFTDISHVYATDIMDGYIVRTKSGLELKCSEIHPLLTLEKSKYVWVKAEDLKQGVKIATLGNKNIHENLNESSKEYTKEIEYYNLGQYISKGNNPELSKETRQEIISRLDTPNKKKIFMEGMLNDNILINIEDTLEYTSFSRENIKYIQINMRDFGIVWTEGKYCGKDKYSISLNKEYFSSFNKVLGNIKSKDKKIKELLENNQVKQKLTEYYWDEIVDIIPIRQKFYDITVPCGSTFISNGIVSHNTGKSTVVKALVDEIGITNNTRFATFTGKASLVLNRKGNAAETMHRLMYYIEDDLSYAGYTKLVFRKRDYLDKGIKLIIVDEISMVSKELMDDLLSFGIPIIALGDPEQLPPVGGEEVDYLKNPDAFLDEIHRQAQGDPIIHLSMLARNKQKIELGTYGKRALVIQNSDVTNGMLTRTGQILCGYNKTRTALNGRLRSLKGFESDLPVIGDKVICTRNNWQEAIEGTPLINGTIGTITGVSDIERNKQKLKLNFMPEFATSSYEGLTCDTQEFLNILKQNVKRNDYNKFDYGYAITVHKCINENTWIYTDKGLMQLKELNNGATENQFKNMDNEIKVYNGKYLERPKGFYNNGLSDNKKIETNNGYMLETSNEHKVTTIGEDGFNKVKLSEELKVGDYLLIRKGQNIYGNNIKLPDEWLEEIKIDVRAFDYRLPRELTEDFATFLGLMLSDGCVAKKRIFLFKRHREVVEEFKRVVDKLFGVEGYEIQERTGGYEYSINSVKIVEFCKKIEGIQPNDKYVPRVIMTAPKNIQTKFIRGVFTDATVQLRKGQFDHIHISLYGTKAIEQLKMILLNMGIVTSKVRDKNIQLSNIVIYKEFAKVYFEEIGFIDHDKSRRLELICKDTRKRAPSKGYDYISNIIKDLILKYNYTPKDKNIRTSIYRKRVTQESIRIFLEESKEVMGEDTNYKYLKDLVYNYYIDTIHSIEETKGNTYCIEMPETHQFVQNGIMACNSQGSEFEDMLLFEEVLNSDMHSRWLYTGITRAEKILIMVAQQRRYW